MSHPDVCIIGAGSSGITVGKALLDRSVSFHCFEMGSKIGGMWRYGNDNGLSCAYRSLHIDTSRKTLGYSDFPIPTDKPDFLSHGEFLSYLEAYADHFSVTPHVKFGEPVSSVDKESDGMWRVVTQSGTSGRYRAVIVANGHLWDPRWPTFAGIFTGEALHASQYRTAAPFDGKRVLVVGIGNSAVDIAVDLSKTAKAVVLSTRTGAHIMSKYLMGVPIDRWTRFLTRKLKLPTPVARLVMSKMVYFANGDQSRFGVPRPKHWIWREHATLSQDLLPAIGHGRIRIKPNVEKLAGQSVHFTDSSAEDFDTIIYATGYKTTFPFLAPSVFKVEDGQPVDLYRRIVSPKHPGLLFAGLVQPIGPTIPLVEVQGRWIAALLARDISLPPASVLAEAVQREHEHKRKLWLGSPRYTLEIDFNGYVKQLNREMARA